jgi:flagellar basal-body rod protein FlgF
MERGIYSAATAQSSSMHQLALLAEGLANIDNNGYREERVVFGDALMRTMRADGGNGAELGKMGSGAVVKKQFTNFKVGRIDQTGNALDLAITSDKGYFAIQTPNGVQYTRDGAMHINTSRQLVNKSNVPYLNQQNQPIQLPPTGGTPKFDGAGNILVNGVIVAQIGVFDGDFSKIQGGTLFDSRNATAMRNPELLPEALERSNVNSMDKMFHMMSSMRLHELAQQAIDQQDGLTQKLIASMQPK